jgi:hypothetical protein
MLRRLSILFVLIVLPGLSETPEAKDPELGCDVRAEVLQAKVDALQARLNSQSAYIELLKTDAGIQYAVLEARGNDLLNPLQAAREKAQQVCGEGFTFDLGLVKCTKTEQPKPPVQQPSDAPSAP